MKRIEFTNIHDAYSYLDSKGYKIAGGTSTTGTYYEHEDNGFYAFLINEGNNKFVINYFENQ